MKIMYLLYSFTIGGTERLTVDICNEMVRRKEDVYLYIVNNNYSRELLSTLSTQVHIELQNRKVGGGDKLKTIWRIKKFIREHRIDVIHCNALTTPELLMLHDLCFRKVKVVHTIHDVGQYQNLKKWNIAYRNHLCDKFIAISESVKEDIIEYGADQRKVSIVYNAIDLKKFVRQESKIPGKQFVIGNVARMMPEKKGQDLLLEAFYNLSKDYSNAVCYFAGGCDAAHKAAFEGLKKKVEEYGLSEKVKFFGNVDNVQEFLSQLHMLVLPSRYEGFGISLIEAMSMGIPCVASNLDGPAEIIGDNEHGLLFEVGNVSELEDRLRFVMENYSSIKEAQHKNVDYVKKNFDIKEMGNKLLTVYRN